MSVSVHLAVGGLMCWLMLRTKPAAADVRPTTVVTVLPGPPDGAETTSSGFGGASGAMTTAVTPVTFKPLPPPRPPRVREVVAEEEVAPVPPPTRPKPKPLTPAVTPVAPVASKPNAKPTTIDEHRKLHPTAVQPTTSTGASRPVTTANPPKINMGEVLGAGAMPTSATTTTKPGAGAGAGSTPAGGGGEEAQADYLARLFAKLRAAHQKPEGLDDGLQTRVEFVVRADGSVSGVRILKTSGNAEFDESVLAAFRQVSGLGAPPAGMAGVNAVTFRTRAE